jgi:SAM-dependent methyltransferase
MQPRHTSSESDTARAEGTRRRAFGQAYAPTLVDRFGVWLSALQIRAHAEPLDGRSLGDFGCGYHAAFVRSVLPRLERAVLVDVALAGDLKSHPKVTGMEGVLPAALERVEAASLDVVLCISVLEHLWNPLAALEQCLRIVRPGGICLFNVPSWRGKRFLEYSAFRLGLSPKDEMDDHKTYYDVKDLWPLLVRAGFRPSGIHCFPHKFGLNTFAACRAPAASTSSHDPS